MTQDFDPNGEGEGDEFDFLGHVDLDAEGHFQADIYAETSDPFDSADAFTLQDMFELIGLDVSNEGDLLDLITHRDDNIEGIGFDFSDADARGGYTRDEVIAFLDETGWWGIADVYYDEDYEEYYIDINYDDGGTA